MRLSLWCAGCGAQAKLEADHKIPLALGGNNWIDNIQPLCRSCNARKGTRLPDMGLEPKLVKNQ